MTRLETQVLDLLREDCRLPLEKLAVMLGRVPPRKSRKQLTVWNADVSSCTTRHHQLGFDRP